MKKMENELMNSVKEKVMLRLLDEGFTMTTKQWDHYSKLCLLFNQKEMVGERIENPKKLEALLYNFFRFMLAFGTMAPDDKLEQFEPLQEWLLNYEPQKK